jgi:hypothetical protein
MRRTRLPKARQSCRVERDSWELRWFLLCSHGNRFTNPQTGSWASGKSDEVHFGRDGLQAVRRPRGLKPSFSSKSYNPAEAGRFQSVLSYVANYSYMSLVLLCDRLGERAARVQFQCLLERLLSAGLVALLSQRDREPYVGFIEIRIELR